MKNSYWTILQQFLNGFHKNNHVKFISCLHTFTEGNTREDSTHGHHQMVNTKNRLIIFFAAKDGEALYSQQKQD